MRSSALAAVFGLTACAGSAQPAAQPQRPIANSASGQPSADCEAIRADAAAQRDAGNPAAAIAIYERGLAACGTGHGFHNELGAALASQGKVDEAAKHYIAELRDPHTAPQTFANLLTIYDRLSADRKAEIATFGTTDDAPIRVPEIRGEYAWVAHFACIGGEGKVSGQALVSAKAGGQLDELMFDCPDGKEHHAYFDFSDDPMEKAMRNELGGKP